MSRIEEAMALIEAEVGGRKGACVIYSDTGPEESNPAADRDGPQASRSASLKA